MTAIDFVIVTGMSGAGKSQAVKGLEDLGYFCVDNLPAALIPTFAQLCAGSERRIERVGLVIDIREGQFLDAALDTLRSLREAGHRVRILFLEASDESLLRRFSETRRPHPLAPAGSVAEGIARERERLSRLKGEADLVLNTSPLTPHELRQYMVQTFGERPGGAGTAVALVSFGYRYGLLLDADLVFDLRCLPNPNFIPALKPLPGTDPAIATFLQGYPEVKEFLDRVLAFLQFALPCYVAEGKAYLTVALGCTGGRHRAPYAAELVAGQLRTLGYPVTVRHRDVERA
ncbi:MAG: RNase adapter RapZ [candidate division NC10 bacterium]|nr:RNase adapter RapZ [candidate division NC10 bacterium]